MKKIAIALLLIVIISAFCACNSQSNTNEGDTASAVSSEISGGNAQQAESTSKTKKGESSTLEVVEGGGEDEVTIEFDGNSTTTKNSDKEKTTEKTTEKTSQASYDLPVIPIP